MSTETKTEKTQKPVVDPQYEKLVNSITKDVEKKFREEQKDPMMKRWMIVGKRVMKIIAKAKENPDKNLFNKSPNDLLPVTRETVRKEVIALINNKPIKSAKDPRSSDAITAMADAFVAEELLTEQELKAKKVEATATTPKTS